MKKISILLIVFFILLLTSCKVRVSNNVNTKSFEDKVAYFQDQNTGAVFAVVAIRRAGSPQQEGVGLAHIPKSDLTPEIIAQIKNYNPEL